MEMIMSESSNEELFPFRRNKLMLQPNHERCKECKGRCCNGRVPIEIIDFEVGKEVDSVLKLLKMGFAELVISEVTKYVGVQTSTSDDGYFSHCSFKCEWGCILSADMRPKICRYYVPMETYIQCINYLQYDFDETKAWSRFHDEFLRKNVLSYPNVRRSF
jgi:Fe-S-cluster containining protein